jgi:hypothetical protein
MMHNEPFRELTPEADRLRSRMSTIAAAAADRISAMEATASPPGIFVAVIVPDMTGGRFAPALAATAWPGCLADGAGDVSGGTSVPIGFTFPSSAKPQFSRLLA